MSPTPLLFCLPADQILGALLVRALGCEAGVIETRRFPDGEAYVRLLSDVRGRDVIFVDLLDRPDEKFLSLYFATRIARDLGAQRIGLVAPYLPYMRQDKIFNSGEGITSRYFANLVSGFCDWLVTVDPHLHRYNALSEVYDIATCKVHAAPAMGAWIQAHIADPLIIGPDAESRQWAEEIAGVVGCPYTVLTKTRHGDHEVEIADANLARWGQRTPVLIDDILSTGRTMISAAEHCRAHHLPAPVCVVVHALFADDAWNALQAAGFARIVSCNSVTHPSNSIDLSAPLAEAIRKLLDTPGV